MTVDMTVNLNDMTNSNKLCDKCGSPTTYAFYPDSGYTIYYCNTPKCMHTMWYKEGKQEDPMEGDSTTEVDPEFDPDSISVSEKVDF